MRVDPASLALFVAVVETGTITAGARRVHLSLAAASTRLQDLESDLGVHLLLRSKKGVQLTSAGTELLRHARTLLNEVERLKHEMAPYAKGLRGRIRLLANTAALTDFLPEPLAKFLSAHPDIDVDLREMWSAEILQTLRRQEADLGILADTLDTRGLQTHAIHTDHLTVACARSRRALLPRKPWFADCLEHPFVGLSAESALHTYLSTKAAESGRPIHYRVRLRAFDAVLRLVAEDVGIAILPMGVARRSLPSYPQLRLAPLRDPWATRKLVLCTHYVEPPAYVGALTAFLSRQSSAPGSGPGQAPARTEARTRALGPVDATEARCVRSVNRP